MANKTQNPPSPPDYSGQPVKALERPTGLKNWSKDLVGIVKGQESHLFDDWTFRDGALTRDDFHRILKKINGCGSVVELRSAVNPGTGEVDSPVVHAANYCGQHTICPYCAGRVQDRRGSRFEAPIKAMALKYPYAYLVTATIAPVPTWREDLQNLISAWQGFRKMGQKRKARKSSRSAGEWGKVRAGLAKVELKRGKDSGLPHCHIHSLVFTDSPIDFKVWSPSEKRKPKADRIPLYKIPSDTDPRGWIPGSKITSEWFNASGGSVNFQVDQIKYRAKDEKLNRSWAESIFDQSREVLKYATKFDSAPKNGAEKLFAKDFIDIRDATFSRRLFITYGDFRKVGDDDFTGGGPHISESPLIFEARWRDSAYSPLMERFRPIFPNSDMTLAVQKRLSILNRALGSIRRIRSGILAAKRNFYVTGKLEQAVYIKRTYLEDGGFNDVPTGLEMPSALVERPSDPVLWETWLDSLMEQGRAYYASVKESVTMDSEQKIRGTLEERQAQDRIDRFAYRHGETYEEETRSLFLETLSNRPTLEELEEYALSKAPS